MPDAGTPDFRLHCRQCPETFIEMTDLIRHREQTHETRPPRKPQRRHTKRAPKLAENTAAGAA